MDFGDQHATPKAEYTLPGILDFLQRSWVQFELERSRWATERAELMARVSQLESERKGKDNIQRDLIRRIKMLEYAIQKERQRYSETTGQQTSKAVPAHVTALKTAPGTTSRLAQINNRRDILKKYLQEIGSENVLLVKSAPAFLVPSLLNKDTINQIQAQTSTPQPNHVNITKAENNGVEAHTNNIPDKSDKVNNSPSRSLAALTESLAAASTPDAPLDFSQLSKDKLAGADSRDLEAKLATFAPSQDSAVPSQDKEATPTSKQTPSTPAQTTPTPTATPTPTPTPTPAATAPKKDADKGMGDMTEAELAEMQNMMGRLKVKGGGLSNLMKGLMGGKGKKGNAPSLFDFDEKPTPTPVVPAVQTPPPAEPEVKLSPELAGLTLDDESANGSGLSQEPGAPRPWRCKYTLRSHFDGVRVVAFHPNENALFSASEDYTLKMWNLNTLAPQPKKGVTPVELEPIYTFRGHTAPIFSMSIHGEKGRIFSAGGDSVIRIWAIPPMSLDTYDPHGVGVDYRTKTIEGHTDAIWSLSHHPHRPHILSASADGSVKLWDYEKSSPLLQTFSLPSLSSPHVPTSVSILQTDLHRCIASYTSAALAVFDLETGTCVLSTRPQDTANNTRDQQVNAVVTHPSLPFAITAREDKKIEFFDLTSGKIVHSIVAHLDAVSTVAVDPSGLYLLSGGHDSSMRFWDINTRTCVQEMNAHRPKYQESIHSVTYHPTRTFIASGGADSTVRIYM